MRHSLQSHIVYLEKTIKSLRNRLTDLLLNHDEVRDLELQLAQAESALAHYREAYALEVGVSNPEPPAGSGSGRGNDTDAMKDSKKKNDGDAAIRTRRMRKAGSRLQFAFNARRKSAGR